MKSRRWSARTARGARPRRRRTRLPSFCFVLLVSSVVVRAAAPSENNNGDHPSGDAASNSNNNPPSPVSSRAADAMNKMLFSTREPEFFRQYATLARRPKPFLGSIRSALFGGSSSSSATTQAQQQADVSALWHSLCTTIHWQDLVLLVALGWGTVPLLQLPYKAVLATASSSSKDNNDDSNKRKHRHLPPYRQSLFFQLADHLQQVSQIAVAVYLVDIVKLLFLALGWNNETNGFVVPANKYFVSLPHAFCQCAYTVWAANRGAALKRRLLRRYVSRHPETFGRVKVLNRLADACIYGLTVAVVLNILQVHMGLALQSFLAFGGVGTLAVGLATKGIAQEVIHGLMLASSDRIYEGDNVQFGNGEVSGTIVQLGWMETILRRNDEVMVSVPNSHLLSQRVSNLSRVRRSQVKQVLRVRLEDADQIPDLIDSIKREIQDACPELITDGSRPFRVHWTNINADHCEITVDTRFTIKPTGDVYLANKQNVLSAIHRALKENNVKLVQPPR